MLIPAPPSARLSPPASLRKISWILLVLAALPAIAPAQDKPSRKPPQDSMLERRSAPENENAAKRGRDAFVQNRNMSLRTFLNSYRSADAGEQSVAYAFLLGIAEGKTCCGYRKFKPTTILETIHSGLRELDPSRYDEPAAYIITEILERNSDSPCERER